MNCKNLVLLLCCMAMLLCITVSVFAQQFAFDFGTSTSPLWAGHTRVTETTVYSAVSGYGWIPFQNGVPNLNLTYVPGLFSRDRGTSVPVNDNLFRDICASERSYNAQLEQEFVVNLANGQYLVYITTGDIQYGKSLEKPITIDVEGVRKVNSIQYDYDLCARVQFTTQVSDGQLNLHFGNSAAEDYNKTWTISGLLIFPYNNEAEIAAAQSTITALANDTIAAREAAFNATYMQVTAAEPTQLFQLKQTDIDRGYILFVRDWMKVIYPNTVPLESEARARGISMWCSPGEYESATLGIYPLISNLEAGISVSDLKRQGNRKITKDNISIRLTGYLPERITNQTYTEGDATYYIADYSWNYTCMEATPKILWPCTGNFNVDETKQVWLTAHVPANTPAGTYRGTVTFTPVGRLQQKLPLTLTVYPITLQKTDRIEGMYWNAGAEYYPENRNEELVDMKEHGISSVTQYIVYPGLITTGGNLTLDFIQLDAIVQEMKNNGVTRYMPLYTAPMEARIRFLCNTGALNMTFNNAYASAIGQIYSHAQANDWPEVLFYPVGEIGNSAAVRDKLRQLAPLIRQTPGAKIYCTANNYNAGVECADYFDYWCCNIQMTMAQYQDVLNRGKVLMRYGNSYNYNIRRARTVSGFGFWRIPATTMYYWHYQSVNGDPFNGTDTNNRDWIASYPSADGPINSIDMEGFREGIDDLNYIYTLQQLIAQANAQGLGSLTVDGQAILAEITACDPSLNQYNLAGITNEKYHEWRLRMAQEIMKIQAALK
jgi:hypothetical protein